jgi:hypothetical protein
MLLVVSTGILPDLFVLTCYRMVGFLSGGYVPSFYSA